ncbi:HAD family hydrolase [Aquibacillus kalidii]|uniref:HAD family hydrolase n=1 Tax=Aquibacillus kalidii TaxID=2762597 RepID=UPI001648DA36|nr:HAD family hydrolase [Aquibacillus kalidii]
METIIFDVDDTLYDQTLPFKIACKKVIQTPLSDEEMERLYVISRKYSDALFERWESGEVSSHELHTYRITAACLEFDIKISEQSAVRFQEVYLAEQNKIMLYSEVEELIETLYQQNKQLAVLTNGKAGHQSMKIKQLGLSRWIPEQHIFISGAVGHAKPSREVFNHIEDKLQLDKAKTVYIGDSFENDIIGAKQAGWKAIWVNHRQRKSLSDDIVADKIVNSPEELLNYFKNRL